MSGSSIVPSTPRPSMPVWWVCLAFIALTPGAAPCAAAADTPPQGAREARAEDPETRRLLGELRKLQPAVSKERQRILEESPGLYALALLKLDKAGIALNDPGQSGAAGEQARNELASAVEMMQALAEGRRPLLPRNGRLERAYLAENDASAQPYALYVPDSYDGSEPFGLLAFLHDQAPPVNKLNWLKLTYPEAAESVAAQSRCILLVPYGRGNTGFRGMGEDDVLRTIAEVRKHYSIDEDRVHLAGFGAGGQGVWSVGAHHPHVFAALIVLDGGSDRQAVKGAEQHGLAGFKAKLLRAEVGAGLVPNFGNLPCLSIYGPKGRATPRDELERGSELLNRRGYDLRSVEFEEANDLSPSQMLGHPEVLRWLIEKRRPAAPGEVSFRAYDLNHNRAYWVEVLGMNDWSRPAEVDCVVDADASVLRVTSDNAMALRLTPPRGLIPDTSQFRVIWNGEGAEVAVDADRSLRLGEIGPSPSGLLKTPELCGPVGDAFAEPFVLVYGRSRQDEGFRRATQAAAEWLAATGSAPTMLPAEAVTQTMAERCNLILFGTPEENPLTARIAPDLPIDLGSGEYRIGGRAFSAGRYGLSMIYPNPLSPERYVVVNCGPAWSHGLAAGNRYDMLPDFIIFRDEPSEDGTDSKRHVAAGFFDQFWRLSEDSTWYGVEPEGQ